MAVRDWARPQVGTRSLTGFRSVFTGGGARPNLFEVGLQWPNIAAAAPRVTATTGTASIPLADRGALAGGGWGGFLCKATSLPAAINGVVEVPFRGRMLKIAGDRTFEPWSITVINDTNMALRAAFERWVNAMATADAGQGLTDPSTYQVDLQVHQLGKAPFPIEGAAGDVQSQNIPSLRTYRFMGCFPTSVSQIDLAYDSNDTIEEFTVEFAVQHWESDGNGGPSEAILT